MSATPATHTLAAYAANAPGTGASAAPVLDAARAAMAAGRAVPAFRSLTAAIGPSPLATAWQHGVAAALGAPPSAHRRPQEGVLLLVAAAAMAADPQPDPSELATAVAVGAEAGLALVAVLGPAQYAAGWDVLGADAAIATAVAAGRLLGLGAPAMAHAIGLAATQSAGLRAADDERARALVWGKVALNGLEAAALAHAGLTAAPAAIEGRRGLAALTAGGAAAAAALPPLLGASWPLARG